MMPNDLPPEAHAYQKAWKKNQRALIKKGADRAYLYVHLEADSGEPFYIGMGETEGRPWSRRRSGKHKNRAKKHGMRVDVDDMPCMSWELAGWWETRWIKAFRDAGYDLVNIADGGDGLSSRAAKEVRNSLENKLKNDAACRQAWANKSQNELLDHGKKVSEGRFAAKGLLSKQELFEWSEYFGSVQRVVQNKPETAAKRKKSSVDRWARMSSDERKEMGRKMSEGRKRAKEAREAAAKLSELKD